MFLVLGSGIGMESVKMSLNRVFSGDEGGQNVGKGLSFFNAFAEIALNIRNY